MNTDSNFLEERLDAINKRQQQCKINSKKSTAEIELSYIRSAIVLAQGSNDIGCEIHIGTLQPIGISVNERIVAILEAEAEEIEKFLRGEENNYE